MELFSEIGTAVSRLIFWASSFLTEEQVPGLISLGIVIWLLASLAAVYFISLRKLSALNWLKKEVQKANDEAEFAADMNRISQQARRARNRRGFSSLIAAWDEFR